ncbi:MAG TPA: prepilin-type N-terminal cleavage/methylation domain-containing protein [Thermodesulfovibrionales bacterium]|nr:prepilin-type N-terminal cleavage/methylation domain-containing protein [Thermodesulfovibrionales bacterium]
MIQRPRFTILNNRLGDHGALDPFAARRNSRAGFTLLEVLVSIALLATAVALIFQLFSADLRAIAASEDYLSASLKANAAMREVLADEKLTEKSSTDRTKDGYRIDVSVSEAMKERTENLQVKLLEIVVTVTWAKGTQERAITLRTLKTVEKKI